MIITIEALDVNNWLKICDLSVSEKQKQWGRPTKVYETDAIFELEERE